MRASLRYDFLFCIAVSPRPATAGLYTIFLLMKITLANSGMILTGENYSSEYPAKFLLLRPAKTNCRTPQSVGKTSFPLPFRLSIQKMGESAAMR